MSDNERLITDGRNKIRGRRSLGKDRMLLDGRKVEFIKTDFEMVTSKAGRPYPRMYVLVFDPATGETIKVWHTQLKPIREAPRTADTPLDERTHMTPPNKATLTFNTLVSLVGTERPTLGRVIQEHDSPFLDKETGTTPEEFWERWDAEKGQVREPLKYYRVRMAGGRIDLLPRGAFEPLAAPDVVWLWRENMPAGLTWTTEHKLYARLSLTPEEGHKIGLLPRHVAIKRPLTKPPPTGRIL
jgi:hypothetical protein